MLAGELGERRGETRDGDVIYDERGEFSTSEQYYREAAERWFVPAMYDLGRILASRDDPEALFWHALSEQEHYEPWDA